MKLELQFMKTRRLWLVDPVTHPGLHPGGKKRGSLTFKDTDLTEETHDSLIS